MRENPLVLRSALLPEGSDGTTNQAVELATSIGGY